MKKAYGIGILVITVALFVTGCTMEVPAQVATPTANTLPVPTNTSLKLVTFDCATYGAEIYYTTNGNAPVLPSGYTYKYTEPFYINTTYNFKVFAVHEQMNDSDVLTYSVTFPTQVATPGVVPVPGPETDGFYATAQTVYLSCATADATIYYTIDGTDPIENGIAYSGPLSITETTTIKICAKKSGMLDSGVFPVTFNFR